jgi:hypothetical protein
MSYKLRADQIRTIDPKKYRFSVNGKPSNTVEEMLQVSFFFFFFFLDRNNGGEICGGVSDD